MPITTPKHPRKKPIPVNEQVSKEDEDALFDHILNKKKEPIKKEEPIQKIIKKEIKKKELLKAPSLKPKEENKRECAPLRKEVGISDDITDVIPVDNKVESEQKRELIEYSIKEVTKYDLNWYYMKEKYYASWHWFWSPYTKYVKWFNEKFNKPLPISKTEVLLDEKEWQTSDNLEDLYEKLPVLEGKYPFEKQELEELMKIKKALRKLEYEEDLSHNIIRSEK